MASGTISISSPSKSAATYLAWSSSSNGSEKNSSVVSATAYFRKTNGYTTTGTFSGTITTVSYTHLDVYKRQIQT